MTERLHKLLINKRNDIDFIQSRLDQKLAKIRKLENEIKVLRTDFVNKYDDYNSIVEMRNQLMREKKITKRQKEILKDLGLCTDYMIGVKTELDDSSINNKTLLKPFNNLESMRLITINYHSNCTITVELTERGVILSKDL